MAVANDGKVLSLTDEPDLDDNERGYRDIKIIDVNEWLLHYGKKELPEWLDILDVGFWTISGVYEEPEHDWRARREHG